MALTSNETTNAAEFMVAKKPTTSTKLKKAGLWFLYIGVPFLILILLVLLMKGYEGYAVGIFLIVMVPLYFCNLLPKMIIPYTKIYVDISYEYVLKQGELFINTIYGEERSKFKKRKPFMPPVLVSAMDEIKPFDADAKARLESGEFEVKYIAYSDVNHPDNYFCVFRNEEGKKCCAVFQNTRKMLKAMAFLNAQNTEKKELSI